MCLWLYFLISSLFLPRAYQAVYPATKPQLEARKGKQTNQMYLVPLAIPLLGIYLEKTIIGKDICTPMFTGGLFTIART